ncbi:MAG: CopG family transcriptional regulator [Thermoplasmata archaeon]|nr:CopG family transcriptional regulator [Thermoplasmata archaeon]
MSDLRDGQRPIHLPEEMAKALEARMHGSSFPDLDAYVAFILARLLDTPSKEPFSEEDERRLRERLRSLGYID